jgi:hypothetical protein
MDVHVRRQGALTIGQCLDRWRLVDEPVAGLAAYFGKKSTVPDAELVRLTAAARAGGSRWAAIAAACGVQTYQDLAGALYRITGETGVDLLFSAPQYAVEQFTVRVRPCHGHRAVV